MAKKILVVEDEETLNKTLSASLKIEGFEVSSALDGVQAWEMAKKEKPDLILLDLILPKMDGFEVLKALKDDETLKEVPIILLTNLESPEDIQKALVAGATTYLVKANYKLEEVIQKAKEVIGK